MGIDVGREADAPHRGIGDRPGLDGLRALAVAAVIAFHIDRMPGGFLGVDLFFVLSGWLITSQLLLELDVHGAVRLRAFWTRRARRLMPASLLVIASVVVVWAAFGPKVVSLRHDTLFAVFWSSNWGTIANGGNYWASFGAASPLIHFWSLAIEEQFYVVWPLVAFGLWRLLRKRRGAMVAIYGLLAAASIVWMNVSFDPVNPTATYMSTFARAHSLLIGAVGAAITMASPAGIRGAVWFRRAAPIAAVAIILLTVEASSDSVWLYHWGFPAFAVAAVVIVVAAADGMGRRVLGSQPMRWIGDRSYGLYLWHWPVILFLTPARLHLTSLVLVVDVVRVALAIALASVSLWLIENPVRRRRILRAWRAPIAAAAAAAGIVAFALTGVAAAPATAPAVVTLPPPVARPVASAPATTAPGPSSAVTTTNMPTDVPPTAARATTATANASTVPSATDGSTPSASRAPTGFGVAGASAAPVAVTAPAAPPAPVRVLVVGDSTAVALADDVDAYAAAHPDQLVSGRAAFGGCGMTVADDGRLHRFDNGTKWIDLSGCTSLWTNLPGMIASEQIDVVLVDIGPWDGDDIKLRDGQIISVLDPIGRAMVASIYQSFVAKMDAAGARVVWVTPADVHIGWGKNTDPLDNPQRWTTMRIIIDGLGVQQIDLPDWLTQQSFDGPSGRPDGVHLTKSADQLFVSELVGPTLTAAPPTADDRTP